MEQASIQAAGGRCAVTPGVTPGEYLEPPETATTVRIVDGQTLRLPIPDLTEDRRKELAKLASQYSEKAKIAVRNVRRDGMEGLKAAEKKGDIRQDEQKKLETEVQKITAKITAEMDAVSGAKEKEILGR